MSIYRVLYNFIFNVYSVRNDNNNNNKTPLNVVTVVPQFMRSGYFAGASGHKSFVCRSSRTFRKQMLGFPSKTTRDRTCHPFDFGIVSFCTPLLRLLAESWRIAFWHSKKRWKNCSLQKVLFFANFGFLDLFDVNSVAFWVPKWVPGDDFLVIFWGENAVSILEHVFRRFFRKNAKTQKMKK